MRNPLRSSMPSRFALFAPLAALALLSNCGRETPSPSEPTVAVLARSVSAARKLTLTASDHEVTFKLTVGGPLPAPAVVSLKEKDGGTISGLSVKSIVPAGFVTATLVGSSTPTKLRIAVPANTRPKGEYKGSVFIDAPGADKSPLEIKVLLSVKSASHGDDDEEDEDGSLFLTVAPAGAAAGLAFTTQPVVEFRNKGGKLLHEDETVTASIVGAPGLLAGTTSVRAHDGVATFTNLSIPTAGTYTLRFTADDFASASATLTVSSRTMPLTVSLLGTGTGTVTSNPTGIDCGATCTATFDANATVTLTALPTPGSSTFGGWSANCTVTSPTTCTVVMSAVQTVTATFNSIVAPPSTFDLTINFTGAGGGSVINDADQSVVCTSPGPCTLHLPSSNSLNITLVAVENLTSTFVTWTGDCVGYVSGIGCDVPMTGTKSVTANFAPIATRLAVARGGAGDARAVRTFVLRVGGTQ